MNSNECLSTRNSSSTVLQHLRCLHLAHNGTCSTDRWASDVLFEDEISRHDVQKEACIDSTRAHEQHIQRRSAAHIQKLGEALTLGQAICARSNM